MNQGLLANRPNATRDPSPRRRLLCSLLTGVCLAASACGGSGQELPQVPLQELPPYTEDEQRIFDDSIAPEVFGLSVERTSYVDEPEFVERVQFADYITRAKLQTVTADSVKDRPQYRVVLTLLGEPIAGLAPRRQIELVVGRASPSLNLLRSMATDAVGRTTIVFVREYRLNEQRVLHFRSEPDSQDVLDAVREVRSRENSD